MTQKQLSKKRGAVVKPPSTYQPCKTELDEGANPIKEQ